MHAHRLKHSYCLKKHIVNSHDYKAPCNIKWASVFLSIDELCCLSINWWIVFRPSMTFSVHPALNTVSACQHDGVYFGEYCDCVSLRRCLLRNECCVCVSTRWCWLKLSRRIVRKIKCPHALPPLARHLRSSSFACYFLCFFSFQCGTFIPKNMLRVFFLKR